MVASHFLNSFGQLRDIVILSFAYGYDVRPAGATYVLVDVVNIRALVGSVFGVQTVGLVIQ